MELKTKLNWPKRALFNCWENPCLKDKSFWPIQSNPKTDFIVNSTKKYANNAKLKGNYQEN